MGRPKGSKNKSNTIPTKPAIDSAILDETEKLLAAESSIDPYADQTDPDIEEDSDDDAPVTQGQLAKAMDRMAMAVETIAQGQQEERDRTVRKIPWAKFKSRSPFGAARAKKGKLTRRVHKNGFLLPYQNLTMKEIEEINKLKPGRYIQNLVHIYEVPKGGVTELHIDYDNSTPDKRMMLRSYWNSALELYVKCNTEGRSDLEPVGSEYA